ncbi:MAG: SDR family NAD(P)-dependent oxidoreductase [Polyangiaceae bacterium]|nr:SDR family NAD(P)-dependent oxidoreductase [Polyangiaceae bacterium]
MAVHLTLGRTLVTGAAGALGSAVCRALTGAGGAVLALDRAEAAPRLAQLAAELGVETGTLDVADAGGWERLAVAGRLQPFSGAVLVAGGWRGGAPITEAPPGELEELLQLNLVSAWVSLRAVLPPLCAAKDGAVVVIGSRSAVEPASGAGSAAYTASKAALLALAQAAAAEVRGQGVRVNAVLPSVIDTAQNRAAMPDADPSRWVSPDALAASVLHLLTNPDVSGAALPVYGRL